MIRLYYVTSLEFGRSDKAHVVTLIGLIKGFNLHAILFKDYMLIGFVLP